MGMLKLQLGRESEVHDSSMVSNVSCLLVSNIFVYLSLGVSIAIKTHNQKQLEEKRMYFILQVSSHNPSLREVKAELKSGTEEELTEHCQVDQAGLFKLRDPRAFASAVLGLKV